MPGFCKSDKEQNSLSFLVADCFTKLCKSILVFPDSKISRGKPKTIQIVKASSLYNYIFCTRPWYSICKPGQANLHHWNCIEFFDHLQKIFFENNKHSLVKFGWIWLSDNCSITTGNTTPLCPESRRRCCLCLTLYVSAT